MNKISQCFLIFTNLLLFLSDLILIINAHFALQLQRKPNYMNRESMEDAGIFVSSVN